MYWNIPLTTQQLAYILHAERIGAVDDELIYGLCSPENPQKGHLCYVRNPNRMASLFNKVKAILISPCVIPSFPDCIFFVSKDAQLSFIRLLSYVQNNLKIIDNKLPLLKRGNTPLTISKSAQIHPSASIGKDCSIGDRCIINANVVLYNNVHLGNDVMIHSGAVLGADGFGFYDKNQIRYKIPHLAGVVIEDNVEIGANTTIDSGIIEPTCIGSHTKIDNLVHIAHQCQVGSYCYIAGQSGLAGHVHLGNHVKIAGQVGIVDHVSIADNSTILAKSLVTRSIQKKKTVLGIPAHHSFQTKRIWSMLKQYGENTSS